MDSEHEEADGARRGKGTLAVIIFGLSGIIAMILLWQSVNAPPGGSGGRDFNGSDARTVCRLSVKQQLKDPDSASFSDETVTLGAGDRWTVTGTVRAENSFGGTAVHRYTCEADGARQSGTARLE